MTVQLRLKFKAASAFAALCIVAATCAASADGEFRSPTGGIGCEFFNNFLRCDVIGGVVPRPPQPRSCPFDWGQGFNLGPHGTASIVCAGDTALNHSTNVVRYGTTWHGGSFACSSSPNGLRCTNADRHGFLISRGEAYRF